MSDMADQQQSTSPSNPCPMLRALVSNGHLPTEGATLKALGDIAARLSGSAHTPNRTTGVLTKFVAMIANGLNPVIMVRNLLRGVRFDQLRDGPLDKHGVGSGVLDALGEVNLANLDRLAQFASDKTDLTGATEQGLDGNEIVILMDANCARAGTKRRAIDRLLMDGEFPLLLKIMGKDGTKGRYLSLIELRTLIIDQRLPARVSARLSETHA
jgi:hypothetical protein